MKIYYYFIKGNFSTVAKFKFNKHKYIFVDGFPHTKNFGDALNTPLVEILSGKEVLPSKNISRIIFNIFRFQNYAVIGSILQWIKKNSEVWGSGFITENEKVIVPSKIHAVRGPKTREIYLKNKIECPEVFGDPALLFPLIYNPQIIKKYKFGIIPHYYDYKNPWIELMRKRRDVLIIDLMVRTDYKKVINQILQCEKILSSSLHGIIISDAYQIPNRQIQLSDKVVGSEFKFADYYLSVDRPIQRAINPIKYQLESIEYSNKISIDLSKLIEVCPFIGADIKLNLLFQLNTDKQFSHLVTSNV